MPVKVKDLIGLELFRSARVVAGKNGLENEIKRVNFSDCPIVNDVIDNEIVMRGDFFINSLYMVKDNYNEMKSIFEFYINIDSAGVCIIDEYIKEVPEVIKKIADKSNFPILFIDKNIPYGEIIKTTTEMILIENIDIISEMRIDKLLNENLSREEIISLATRINGSFNNFYTILYINFNKLNNKTLTFIRNEVSNNIEFEAIKYKKNIIIVINHNKEIMIDFYINYVKNIISKHIKNYKIGISHTLKEKEDFSYGLKQAFNASELSEIINENIVYYKDLSVYKLIYPIRNSRIIKEYYEDIIVPLKEYDEYYNSNILETVKKYLEFDGDYKKAAAYLNQHENTVRYRVLKAKKILYLEDHHFKFIEQVSIGLKINELYK